MALNPFKSLPHLYAEDVMRIYSTVCNGENLRSKLEPHIFAVAQEAFFNMKNELRNQSVIVSGESGAGKTVSAKYIMRYLASISSSKTSSSLNVTVVGKSKSLYAGIEEKVLASNPIMEAFGNAKTVRNDNSSRFGKYIELRFDSDSRIVGAFVRTYLLEKARVTTKFTTNKERNYHIFYQLMSHVKYVKTYPFEDLYLLECSSYHYIGDEMNSGSDEDEFKKTLAAMSEIGVSQEEIWKIFKLLAIILHIGNLEAEKIMNNDVENIQLCNVSKLLGCKTIDLIQVLGKKKIVLRSETIFSDLNEFQIISNCDSFARCIYSLLFDWIVKIINDSLFCLDGNSSNPNWSSFIGVLDIYGFEYFENNGFEQFCINYANEKLQQAFNLHVFKLEQQLYLSEGISWSLIDFQDNAPLIKMIEGRLGIINLLDEESKFPNATHETFNEKLFKNLKDQPYYQRPKIGAKNQFKILHFAHEVTYDCNGFLEKNKDRIPEEFIDIFNSSSDSFINGLCKFSHQSTSSDSTSSDSTYSSSKLSLISGFKGSLNSLMETLSSTNTYYVRCIKTNEAKKPFEFSSSFIMQQLKACGVLETIKISCAGYPTQLELLVFYERYQQNMCILFFIFILIDLNVSLHQN